MPERKMFRYVVLVNDQPTTVKLTGDPVAVAATTDSRAVEFWAENDEWNVHHDRTFQVFGTGQPIPDGAQWVGTCPRTSVGLVWHLYELAS